MISVVFLHAIVAENLRVAAKEHKVIPFAIPVPWVIPLNIVDGRQLPGVQLGVRTELAIAKSRRGRPRRSRRGMTF